MFAQAHQPLPRGADQDFARVKFDHGQTDARGQQAGFHQPRALAAIARANRALRLARQPQAAPDQPRQKRQELGRSPNADELAARLGIPAAELGAYATEAIQLSSLDASYDDQSAQYASDQPDPFALLSEMEDRDRLVEAMATLPDRLKLVLQLHFVEELNLTEIARVLDVSVPRVHQLKVQALTRLRDAMNEDA